VNTLVVMVWPSALAETVTPPIFSPTADGSRVFVSGNRIELVVRPLNSGWRYFPSRDAGITGLADVMLRSVDVEKDVSIWSGVLGAQVSDWAGDAAYLRFDDSHHRIALFPARRPGILCVEYAVLSSITGNPLILLSSINRTISAIEAYDPIDTSFRVITSPAFITASIYGMRLALDRNSLVSAT
jgi:hypothetical protein